MKKKLKTVLKENFLNFLFIIGLFISSYFSNFDIFVYLSIFLIICLLANLVKNKWRLTLMIIIIFIMFLFFLLSLTHLNMAKFNLIWIFLYFPLYPFSMFIFNIKVLNKITLWASIPINIVSIILYIYAGILVFVFGLILSIGPLQEYYFDNTPVSSVKFTTIGDDIFGGRVLMTLYDENDKQIGFEEVFSTGNASASIYYNEVAICTYDNGFFKNSYDVNALKSGNIEPSTDCDSVMKNGTNIIVASKEYTPTITL